MKEYEHKCGLKYVPKNTSGIYIIQHDITNQFYIGQSNDIATRLSHHFSNLKKGKSNNRFLLNLYNESKHEDFSFYYIQINDEDERKLIEKYMLAKHKFNDLLLNSVQENNTWVNNPKMKEVFEEYKIKLSNKAKLKTGEKNAFYGKHHTDKSKALISKVHKNKRNYNDHKPIVINGKKYDCILDASKYLNIPVTTISHRCYNKNKIYLNWYFYHDKNTVEIIDETFLFDPSIKNIKFVYEINNKIYFDFKDIIKDYPQYKKYKIREKIKDPLEKNWIRLV